MGRSLTLLLLLVSLLTSLALTTLPQQPPFVFDPLTEIADLYAFRSPDDSSTVTLIATFIPFQPPERDPLVATFGENIRYEVHVKNDASTTGDDIIYRFLFTHEQELTGSIFTNRIGKQSTRVTYTLERISRQGSQTIISQGSVPPHNTGPRTIDDPVLGFGQNYDQLKASALVMATTGERVFCGPADDPFFADLGGLFDLGATRKEYGSNPANANVVRDALAGYNVHTIALQIPIQALQKDGKAPEEAEHILDDDFVIGVWASTSRPRVRTLSDDGAAPTYSGDWVQISRRGMPLTDELFIPVDQKARWHARSPYTEDSTLFELFYNPELALYMDEEAFGGLIPELRTLRIQRNALQQFDFGNGQDGLYPLRGDTLLEGTLLADDDLGPLLLPAPAKPRGADLWPLYHSGFPNQQPFQMANRIGQSPWTPGKPFINNFMPTGGDMLRLNMAVPATPRTDPDFHPLGLVYSFLLGMTDTMYTDPDLEFIPNMDGFPNGRRLEDDVTTITMQAMAGVMLAASGFWYDDYFPENPFAVPITNELRGVLNYTAGPAKNDLALRTTFPYVPNPHRGYDYVKKLTVDEERSIIVNRSEAIGLNLPGLFYSNPIIPTRSTRPPSSLFM